MTATHDRLQVALRGRYALGREVGHGGMATVYLARDEKHQRNVALKVLNPELGAVIGAERFLSEIRVTAGLQHPNLLPLFDSGEAGGLLYYVMPFVEGETLRHLLDREKQLPIGEAVRIAVAIATALDYAHGHGVVHRDLKPENILIQAGQPVIADFGIALAVSNAGGARITQTGLSLGTPQYMSPEQASGDRVIDGRTDVYSLGAMMYEMLAGEPPHTGSSAQAIIAKLMTTEPRPVRVLRPSVPANVAMAVEHALAKLPADRVASAKQFADALTNKHYSTETSVTSPVTPTPTRATRAFTLLATLSGLLLITAVWGWLRPAEPGPLVRYVLAIDSTEQFTEAPRWGRVALSPDGSTLVYVGGPESGLMLRRRDELNAKPIPGTAQAGAPVFSPDGKQIAFLQMARTLMIAPIDGSPPYAVTDSLVGLAGLSWSTDGYIYADGQGSAPLVRVAPRAAARPALFGTLDTAAREIDQLYPEPLPDGKGVLYTSARNSDGGRRGVAILDPGTRIGKPLIEDAQRVRYSPSGHLIYVTTTGNLMSVRFDLSTLSVIGDPVLIAQGLSPEIAVGDFTVSSNGTIVFVGGPSSADDRAVTLVHRDGTSENIDPTWSGAFEGAVLSPDGQSIAVSTTGAVASQSGGIWIMRLKDKARFKLSVEPGQHRLPQWSPDGRTLRYVTQVGDTFSIVDKPADGSAAARRIFATREQVPHITGTPDGQTLLYTVGGAGTVRIKGLRIADKVTTQPFPDDAFARTPAISPDGKWIAYSSSAFSRVSQVFVSPYPDIASAKWDLGVANGVEPVWSRSGRTIFIRNQGTRVMMSVSVSTSPTFSFGAPKEMFSTARYVNRAAPGPDDSTVLMVRRLGGSRERVTVIENWTRILARDEKP